MFEADNPKVKSIVLQVNQDSLASYVTSLVGFFTRHTNSDTSSQGRGIGAARRWVFDQLQSISIRNGGKLKVSYHTFEATIRDVPGLHRNVIAELPGTLTPERKFVVSGHLDSRNSDNSDAVNFAPGANDDGSGVAGIIELARVLSQFEFESSLVFVAFTGEEQGLFGSRAYASDLRSRNADIVGMVTNDVIGNIKGGSGDIDSLSVRCFSEEPPESRDRQLARFIKIQGEAYLPDFKVTLIPSRDRPGRGGDHFSFNEAGYTAARLTEPEDDLNHQHNMDDLPEFMSFPYLTRVVKVNAAFLSTWADAPVTPSRIEISTQQGMGQHKLTWGLATELDFSNYLIAFRDPSVLSYDSLVVIESEEIIFETGNTTNGVFVSVSAVDQDGNESIFSQEIFTQ